MTVATSNKYPPERIERARAARWGTQTDDERFWSKVDRSGGPDACWLWLGPRLSRPGYDYGTARRTNKRQLAHRFAWELFNGPMPAGLEVCHTCDNPPCVNPAHLFLGTHADNMADMARKERGGAQKLDERQVRLIHAALTAGRSQPRVAAEFGISKTMAWHIGTGREWGHLGLPVLSSRRGERHDLGPHV